MESRLEKDVWSGLVAFESWSELVVRAAAITCHSELNRMSSYTDKRLMGARTLFHVLIDYQKQRMECN